MKLPGLAWLELSVDEHHGQTVAALPVDGIRQSGARLPRRRHPAAGKARGSCG
jgi:hypothetical protein